MNTSTVSLADITNTITIFAVVCIVALTAASTLLIYLYRRNPHRPAELRNLAIALGLAAVTLLGMWTVIAEHSSPAARTTVPSTVEGQ
ncbi:hypothetical protein IU436_29775 [Nocardia farcinica]|uniref:hypothetical protein n=1 Tax=Nocardia farcinica TaxID=37329 RepID=UPI00189488A9|nr:hypothetical protein [Nocardia farcinica]MBF6422892.1 hypothetical protein [Nocardia farcinica]MBF6434510.1 hypothetical protein [Nocardia farcinica]MBF6505595.1 hypothetical protein [Nocardia farcinica]